MSTDHWRALSECLDRALDVQASERTAWLTALRLTDSKLADEVADLLAQRDRPGYRDFLAEPLMLPGTRFEHATLIGRQVGPYVVECELGRGGMGSVWRARRTDERFENTVAIKFLHASWMGLRGEQRFRAEGQILGRLNHPNIARLIDAGLLDETQPYLVLEFIAGEAIDAYCRRAHLALDARIALFLEVLAAVGHAHSHLIVHRDIKPANIFVTQDGSVKLLDFGIAKLLDPDPVADRTQPSAMALTPQFAAPEQLLGQTVTTATDVYSLGLVLYVLLTGRHPVGSDSVSHAQLLQAALTDDAPYASCVGEVATVPRRSLEGDLDNILAKALKKEPAERYASVGDFAADLKRYLVHEPVKARPDTAAYRMTKFVRRHRGGVASGALTVLFLCSATAVTFMQKVAADRQRDAAEFEARRAESSNEFLNLLLLSDGGSTPLSSVARLDLGAHMLELQYRDDPRFAGRMLVQLASQYRGNTATKQALALDARAYDLGKDENDLELMALAQCAAAYAESSSGLAASASERIDEARRLIGPPVNAPVSLQVECDRADAQTAQRQGNYKSAESTLEHARHLLEDSQKAYLAAYTSVLNDLGGVYNETGRPAQALAMAKLIGATHELYGRGGTTARLMAMQNEAAVLVGVGEFQAALRVSDEVRKRRFAILGDASEPLSMTVNYASTLVELGRQPEGISQAHAAFTRAKAAGNIYWMLFALITECHGEIEAEHFPQAQDCLQQLAAAIDNSAATDPSFPGLVDRLRALLQLHRGEAQEAIRSVQISLASSSEAPGSLNLAAQALIVLGKPIDAEKYAQHSLGIAEAVARGPDTSAEVGEALLLVAKAKIAEGQRAEAKPLLERSVRCLTNGLGPNHPHTEEAIHLAAASAV